MPKAKLPKAQKSGPKNLVKTSANAVSENLEKAGKQVDNSKFPKVLVVILHYKVIENTRKCLRSVFKLDYPNFNVLLIDNGTGSTESKDLIREFTKLLWMPLSDNEGFAGGCNSGISYAIQNKYSYVWILNNDATTETDTLRKLVDVAVTQDKVGAANAAVLEPASNTSKDGQPESTASTAPSTSITPGRGIIDYRRGKTLLRPTDKTDFVDCDWLAASNILLNLEALREVGAFDERYFLYFEDVELCHRLRLGNWRCLHVPSARVSHVGGASTEDSLKHWRSYYYTRNRLLFFQTYANLAERFTAFFCIWMHLLRHCFSLPMKGEAGNRQLQSEIAGAQDFITASYGKWKNSD